MYPGYMQQTQLRVRTKSTVTYQQIVATQVRSDLVEELNVMGTLGVSDEIENSSTGQASKTYHTQQWEAAAGLLLGFLRIDSLVCRSIGHRKSSPIDDFNVVPPPQSLCGHALLSQAVSMSENLLDPLGR
jgi:hypothetical protein